MKKTISTVVAVALLAALSAPASAGGYYRGGFGRGGGHGHGGFGIGAFFAGLLGGAIITSVIENSRPAVVYAPPPAPDRVWVEGRYQTRYERRWVPGHWEGGRDRRSLWNEDGEDRGYRDGDRDDEDGGRVWVPGSYSEVPVRVWVEGHYEDRG